MAADNQDRWRRKQANRTKGQVEIEILDLGRKQENPREQSAFVPKGVPDGPGSVARLGRVPAGTPITGIGVVKDSTTRRLDEGANDRSRRVSDLDSCTGNSWNYTPNAEPRIQRTIAPGIRMGALLRAEFEIQSLSRQTGESDSTPFDREVKHDLTSASYVFTF
jgi:hypothetical protein